MYCKSYTVINLIVTEEVLLSFRLWNNKSLTIKTDCKDGSTSEDSSEKRNKDVS